MRVERGQRRERTKRAVRAGRWAATVDGQARNWEGTLLLVVGQRLHLLRAASVKNPFVVQEPAPHVVNCGPVTRGDGHKSGLFGEKRRREAREEREREV